MKLSELIAFVGDENITLQNVINVADAISKTTRGTKITFYADPAYLRPEDLLHGGKPSHVGLVVWMPADLVEAARAKADTP